MGPSEDLDDAKGAWVKTECEAFAKANPDFNIEFKYVTSSESEDVYKRQVLIDTPSRAAISLIVAIVFILSYVIIKLYIYYQK